MYQLIIHHDVGVKKDGHVLTIDKHSPGHVYLELRNKEESIVRGILSGIDFDLMNPQQTLDTYQKYILHGKERLKLAREYEAQYPNNKICHSKIIKISENQYKQAKQILTKYDQYLGREIPSETYGVFGNNCTHFVNKVYRAIGLEGDYTRHYSSLELDQISTELTKKYKAFFNLHPGDKAFTVFGSSIEEVAKKYNVDVTKVTKKKIIPVVPDMEAALMQEAMGHISFEIAPNPELLNKKDSSFEEKETDSENEPNKAVFNSANKVINEKVNKLLSDPNYLKQYQAQSIKDGLEGLKQAEQFVPGITKAAAESMKEHNDFLQQLMGIKSPTANSKKSNPSGPQAEQISKDQKTSTSTTNMSSNVQAQPKAKEQNISDHIGKDSKEKNWLDNLLSNTETMMNDLSNDPEMQQFMQMLGKNSILKPEDEK